jgi:hypothetical protein
MDDELAATLTALAFYTVYLLGLCLAVVVSWGDQQSVFWSSVDGLLSWLCQDPDAAPEADAAWLRNVKLVIPGPKKAISIRLDRDITESFQGQGGIPDPS